MATAISEIITSASVLIDDERLAQECAVNPAGFYRKMWFFVTQAMPLLSRPQELLGYLQSELTEPRFDSAEWTSTQEATTQQTVVDTGMVGFALCSVTRRSADGMQLAPYREAQYNALTGEVTFPIQESSGTVYVLDFYSDGSFATLTRTMLRLFSLAIAVVWDERFERNWLNMQPKIKDSSFSTVNEGTFLGKNNAREKENRKSYNDELRKYEQDCHYQSAKSGKGSPTLL